MEEVYTIKTAGGDIFLDAEGNVLRRETEEEKFVSVVRFDLDEFKYVWGIKDDVPTVIDGTHIRGLSEDGTETVGKDYAEARRLRPGFDNFQKHNVSPYAPIVQRMSNKTRAARRAKRRRKQALAENSHESATVSDMVEG